MKIALLDHYSQQVQGLGVTKAQAFAEAKSWNVEGLPSIKEIQTSDQFAFIEVTEEEAAILDENPCNLYGELACRAYGLQ